MKLPFSSNLERSFYKELLHLIGLTEINRDGRKLIKRNPSDERHSGTLLEGAMGQLERLDKITCLAHPQEYGNSKEEQLFNCALELSLTWINRIFFLKLLEAQLIRYHNGDQSYGFLNPDKIKNYGDLNTLFFEVLGERFEKRMPGIRFLFENVPYLNSSIFAPTSLERQTLMISNLDDGPSIPVFFSTVLGEAQGERLKGNLPASKYLLDFLNVYDFSLEGSGEEENKKQISACFLGDILEKIGGEEGVFVIPDFIRRFMAREVTRKAVLQKFNDAKNWNCQNLEELHRHIEDRTEANQIINSITVCDPDITAGHFLVSVLKEVIAVKSELGILNDRNGRHLKAYTVELTHDELLIRKVDGGLFEYQPFNKESQRVQEALFHEKQTIINKCLFGIGIDSKSVGICRWLLGVELLKSVYYKELNPSDSNASPVCYANSLDLRPEFLPRRELKTLPNMDINIQCGNSLIFRIALDADLRDVFSKSKWSLEDYRLAVETYRNAEDKEPKREMEKLVSDIKHDWCSVIHKSSFLKGKMNRSDETEWADLSLSEPEEAKTSRIPKLEGQETEIASLEMDEFSEGKIHQEAFEWRFEFPEILNEHGDFVGFDVVIGSPTAVRPDELLVEKRMLSNQHQVDQPAGNRLFYFYELGHRLLRKNGVLAFINRGFDKTDDDKTLRGYLVQNLRMEKYVGFERDVFDDLKDCPVLLLARNSTPKGSLQFLKISKADLDRHLLNNEAAYRTILQRQLGSNAWDF